MKSPPESNTVLCRVVHFKKEAYDIYIGRPSKWKNPFIIGVDGSRSEVIAKYENWIRTQPELMDALPELRNKVLGCWCKPKACHGEVLAKLVEELEPVDNWMTKYFNE